VCQADGPPVKTSQHSVHGALEAFWIAERAAGVELFPGTGKGDAVAHGDGVELGEDETELLDCAETTGDSAIGDEGHGLGVPFLAVGVDEGFERRGVSVVVLGCDDDEGIARGEALFEGQAAI